MTDDVSPSLKDEYVWGPETEAVEGAPKARLRSSGAAEVENEASWKSRVWEGPCKPCQQLDRSALAER